jgi:hypothetical protein
VNFALAVSTYPHSALPFRRCGRCVEPSRSCSLSKCVRAQGIQRAGMAAAALSRAAMEGLRFTEVIISHAVESRQQAPTCACRSWRQCAARGARGPGGGSSQDLRRVGFCSSKPNLPSISKLRCSRAILTIQAQHQHHEFIYYTSSLCGRRRGCRHRTLAIINALGALGLALMRTAHAHPAHVR